jgi:hypothetical protein
MQFIVEFWWLWLLITIASYMYIGYNQYRRMNNMLTPDTINFKQQHDNFMQGVLALFIAGTIGSIAMLLFILAAIAASFLAIADKMWN